MGTMNSPRWRMDGEWPAFLALPSLLAPQGCTKVTIITLIYTNSHREKVRRHGLAHDPGYFCALPNAIRRYSRLPACATGARNAGAGSVSAKFRRDKRLCHYRSRHLDITVRITNTVRPYG